MTKKIDNNEYFWSNSHVQVRLLNDILFYFYIFGQIHLYFGQVHSLTFIGVNFRSRSHVKCQILTDFRSY